MSVYGLTSHSTHNVSNGHIIGHFGEDERPKKINRIAVKPKSANYCVYVCLCEQYLVWWS